MELRELHLVSPHGRPLRSLGVTQYARTEGIVAEPIGDLWAVFCPTSGETSLLNNESMAVLEVLEAGPAGTAAICGALAEDSGESIEALQGLIETCWAQLVEMGLVRELLAPRTMLR